MLFIDPVVAGQGNNSAQVIRRVFGVVIACGLTASCSATSDFGTQMGFVDLAAQSLDVGENGSDPVDTVAAAPDQPSEMTAFAKPDTAPSTSNIEASSVNIVAAATEAPEASAPPTSAMPLAEADEPADAANDIQLAEAKPAEPEKKRSLFSSWFGKKQAQAPAAEAVAESAKTKAAAVQASTAAATAAEPEKVDFAEKASERKPVINVAAAASSYSASVLPGVRENRELFDIVRKSNDSDDSDIDLYEGEGSYQIASAAGLARLAPHGLLKQRDDVDTSCFKPQLVRILKTIERHYGKPVMVTSGYRSPEHNRRVRGARKSAHMACAAADIQVAGVSRWELARFARGIPGRGGVGTYCHTASVHVDVGSERDWNWRCRK